MPRLTRRPWFGPRRVFGWGWTPVTWQGWLVTAVFVVAIVLASRILRRAAPILAVDAVLILVFIAICYLTGTPPGGTWGRGGDK